MCDECTWHHKTFLVQLYWHLAIKLYCVVPCGIIAAWTTFLRWCDRPSISSACSSEWLREEKLWLLQLSQVLVESLCAVYRFWHAYNKREETVRSGSLRSVTGHVLVRRKVTGCFWICWWAHLIDFITRKFKFPTFWYCHVKNQRRNVFLARASTVGFRAWWNTNRRAAWADLGVCWWTQFIA